MTTKVLVAIVHPIGEDNEANFAVVATSDAELTTKLLGTWNELMDEDLTTLVELEATQAWYWLVEEHEL